MMQDAIVKMVRAHNKERDLERFNKGLKFHSMNLYNKEGYENVVVCHSGVTMTRYELKLRFKAGKYEDNIVKYMFNMYSNGECGFYFDGTEYEA